MSPIGPVILDLIGPELSAQECELLNHPLVGGIILFSRHYQTPEQITQLCQAIRKVRSQPILIAVDQEGGRVQRFQTGFTRIPSMGQLGQIYETSPGFALQLAHACGWIIAAELLSVGVDLSFAPVLDLDKNINPAIGNRAFHTNPAIVTLLANAVMEGMHEAGMAACGKHFPGHGSVNVDSHLGLPIDTRSFDEVNQNDLIPFKKMIQSGIDALMPAHILFPQIDDKPVGFSRYWLQTILRQQLGFSGVIFSDDLNMKGADAGGVYAERAEAALNAGCDMVLICNNRKGAIEILDQLPQDKYQFDSNKLAMLQGKRNFPTLPLLQSSQQWQEKNKLIINFSTREIS